MRKMLRGTFALLSALLLVAELCGRTEGAAVFGIGMRIIGDQLLMKDDIEAPPGIAGELDGIRFNYAISEPITYIEILSKENVLADVSFSYQNELVKGKVTKISSFSAITPYSFDVDGVLPSEGDELAPLVDTSATTAAPAASSNESFKIEILIYGFRGTMLNLNPAYVLNRDQEFNGRMEPQQYDQEIKENTLEDAYSYEDEDEENATTAINDDDVTDSSLMELTSADKYIEVGQRRDGDYLIYESYQVSPTQSSEPSNHSVVFYYIDSNYITYVKFIIFDHFVGKPENNYTPPSGDYTHFSAHTLKATITDYDTTSLFVQLLMYGYKPKDRPSNFVPFLQQHHYGNVHNHEAMAEYTDAPPISAPHELKRLLNAGFTPLAVTSPKEESDEAEQMMTDLASADAQDYQLYEAGDGMLNLASALTFNHRSVKTWWMAALPLLRMLTAQRRA